jgi:hypothetical protein
MWANWLRAYIPRTLDHHTVALTKVALKSNDQTFKRQTGDPHSRRIKCVCRDCNNGWMGKLQEDAKPFLVPILEGRSATLKRNGQIIMAAWAAMMIMVAEHLDIQMVAIPAADRRWLRNNLRPPSHWRIWIGRHAAVSHPLFTHNVVSMVPEKEIERIGLEAPVAPNTQTSTILLGKHLIIHVMSSAVARHIIRRWKLPVTFASSLTQIWPIISAEVIWPPIGDVLLDTAIDTIAQQFFRAGDRLTREKAFFAGYT